MSEPIYINNVRLSFPHLKAPHAAKPTAKAKYQVDLIIPPDHPAWVDIMTAVQAAALRKYGEQATAMLNLIQQDRQKRCWGSGNEKINRKTMAPFDGYAGMNYLAPKTETRIQLIKADAQPVDASNDMAYMAACDKFYGGCYVNAAVDIYASKENDGIFAGLIALQFAKDGEPFGEAVTDASGMFKPVAAAPAGFSPAGGTAQPQAAPFGAAQTPADPGMPAAPFPAPGLPGFLGGGN